MEDPIELRKGFERVRRAAIRIQQEANRATGAPMQNREIEARKNGFMSLMRQMPWRQLPKETQEKKKLCRSRVVHWPIQSGQTKSQSAQSCSQ